MDGVELHVVEPRFEQARDPAELLAGMLEAEAHADRAQLAAQFRSSSKCSTAALSETSSQIRRAAPRRVPQQRAQARGEAAVEQRRRRDVDAARLAVVGRVRPGPAPGRVRRRRRSGGCAPPSAASARRPRTDRSASTCRRSGHSRWTSCLRASTTGKFTRWTRPCASALADALAPGAFAEQRPRPARPRCRPRPRTRPRLSARASAASAAAITSPRRHVAPQFHRTDADGDARAPSAGSTMPQRIGQRLGGLARHAAAPAGTGRSRSR